MVLKPSGAVGCFYCKTSPVLLSDLTSSFQHLMKNSKNHSLACKFTLEGKRDNQNFPIVYFLSKKFCSTSTIMRNSLCTQSGAFEREAKAHQEEDDDCEQTSDVDLMLRPSPPKEEEKYGAEQVEEDLALMVKGSSVPRLVSGLILLPGPLLAPAHHDHDNFQLHRSFHQQSLPL